MSKKVIISVISLITLFSATSALAEVSLLENADTRVITVKGNIEGTEDTNLISLKVKNKDGDVIYPAFIPTKGGEFEYSFKLPDESGLYKMIFTPYDITYKEELDFEYVSNTDMEIIIKTVNNATTDAEIVKIMNEKYTVLNISEKWYEKLKKEDKEKMAQMFLEKSVSEYTSLEDVKKTMQSVLSIVAFDIAENSEEIEIALEDFEQKYNLEDNTTLYSEYEAFSDKEKKTALEIMSAGDCDSFESLYKLFDEGVVLSKIVCAKQPSDITEVIEENRNLLDFDLENFDKANKNKLAKYLFGKSVKSMDDLEELIEKGYKNQKTTQGGGGGGGGNGSGSSKNTGSVSTLPYLPETEVAEIKKETETKPEKNVFADMDDALWAKEAVEYLAEKGIVNGVGDNLFNPNGIVTREAFIKMIVTAFNIEAKTEISAFSDVPAEHWAKKAIIAAYDNGIVNGIGDSLFGLGDSIKRQDIAVILARVASKYGYELKQEKSNTLSDMDDVSEHAKESVDMMIKTGIINGYAEDNTFRPEKSATRAEVAKIIYMILTGGENS